ncbi:MAG: YHYH domain-containing protein [Candidatus Lambdaproteobacteria bacterium]|nr:YHYH domain-containing protein [Candidatus Lambdaproteobacteria bacterium]
MMPHAQHGPYVGRLLTASLALLGLLLGVALLWPSAATAHPGTLDEYGGHFDERTGIYHYHRPKADLVRRKREYLTWITPSTDGELRGDVASIDRPDAIWVQVPYRPAFQDLVPLVARSDRDDRKQLVRVWFRFVSPEASVTLGREYQDWFRKKVTYELDTKLKGKAITVQFHIYPAGRMKGMVLVGEENVNLWLVLNGWSYPVLTDGDNPHVEQFRKAEDNARKSKTGLWERVQ